MIKQKQKLIEVATGQKPADLVLKNACFINIFSQKTETADIAIADDRIAGIGSYHGHTEIEAKGLVLPGFIDAHIHLESSLASPAEFARAVLPHGTTTVFTDPHEIANVMGTDGIDYMLQATEGLPLQVRFMLPACVPASPIDESGATLDAKALWPYFDHERVHGLAEMMNFPGLIAAQPEVMAKITMAQSHHKLIDGHAPMLKGQMLNAYAAAGISSDHECTELEEALEKLSRGLYIMIREGTAAKNLTKLSPLLCPAYADRCMFCGDDKHADELLTAGHIDDMIRRALALGADPVSVIKAASYNAARYFGLKDLGAIAPGFVADLVIVDELNTINVKTVLKQGRICYENGTLIDFPTPKIDDRLKQKAEKSFHLKKLSAADFEDDQSRAVIGIVPGEIITTDQGRADKIDPQADILRLAVVERHHQSGHIGLGYLKGYGLKKGAVASSIAHDSHNLIVVGENAADMATAANQVAKNQGGIAVVAEGRVLAELPLPVAGLMAAEPLFLTNQKLEIATAAAKALGVKQGIAPFMTLSFMALPVISSLRLTTKGVFNVDTQSLI